MRRISAGAISIISLISLSTVQAVNNGVGLTPAMGWNTWNKYGCNINADVIKANADKIVDLGLDKLGYVYVNIDDCWMLADRNKEGRL